jgi:hypothetical protein
MLRFASGERSNMIISASYKTDIPAFYSEWFSNRLAAGYCKVINPMNQAVGTVSLRKDDVSGYVFWTRNIRPCFENLEVLRKQDIPFYVQFTATAYPRLLEPRVIAVADAIAQMRELSSRFGSSSVVWRYDPILLSNLSTFEFHIENFQYMASALSGVVDEVVTSFVHGYAKTYTNLRRAGEGDSLEWYDPDLPERHMMIARLVEISFENNMRLSICSQLASLVEGAFEARCIDSERLSRLAQRPIVSREKGNRPECRCAASRDIGAYDTCPHGCAYCYAVKNRNLALKRYKAHSPFNEFLFEPAATTLKKSGDLFQII